MYSFAVQNQQMQLNNDRVNQIGQGNAIAQDQMAQSQQYVQMQQQQQYGQVQMQQAQQQQMMMNGGNPQRQDYRYREYL